MALAYKTRFTRATEVAYLDTAAEGLPLPECEEALRQYWRDKSLGTPGRKRLHAVEAETLDLLARFLGAGRSNVALLSSASEALNVLPSSLDWQPGDEAIISDLEFPSNVLPWLRLRQKGVQIQLVASTGGALRFEDIAARISSRTRLISLSLVSYKTGALLPFMERLAGEARRAGAILSIDATQALGRLPVSLDGIDFLVSSSFKWLLAPHGLGIVYLTPAVRERLDPAAVGWYSVKNCFSEDRFERYELKDGAACLSTGMPNFGSMYGLRESLRFLLEAGVERIRAGQAPLVERLRRELPALGLRLLTPAGEEYASGIVAFEHPQAEQIGAALERAGVIVWAGDGRVRASVHLYNDAADIDRYLGALRAVLAEREALHV